MIGFRYISLKFFPNFFLGLIASNYYGYSLSNKIGNIYIDNMLIRNSGGTISLYIFCLIVLLFYLILYKLDIKLIKDTK